jgi:hypothetical protein
MTLKRTITVLFLALTSVWAAEVSALVITADTDYVISGYEVVLVFHELLLVFWLGPDIGIFLWSRKAINPELSDTTRITAAGLMHKIDLFPRVCISLMLTVGGFLTEAVGIEHPWWQMVGIVLLGPVWLSMVLVGYFKADTSIGTLINKYDFAFRSIVIVTMIASIAYSSSTGRLDGVPWVTGKLGLFAAIVFFGMIMRLRLQPFLAAMKTMASEGSSDALNTTITSSLNRARPFVFAIWIALIAAAWLGIAQPGSPIQDIPIQQVSIPAGLAG